MVKSIDERIGDMTGLPPKKTTMQISRESLDKIAARCKKNETYEDYLKRIKVI